MRTTMPFEIDVATLGQFHETYGIEYLSAIAKYQQQFTLQPNKKYFITHLIEQLKANNYLNQDDSPRDNKSRQFINKLISVLLNNIDPRIIFNAPQNNNGDVGRAIYALLGNGRSHVGGDSSTNATVTPAQVVNIQKALNNAQGKLAEGQNIPSLEEYRASALSLLKSVYRRSQGFGSGLFGKWNSVHRARSYETAQEVLKIRAKIANENGVVDSASRRTLDQISITTTGPGH
jgi:hypothetical protein